MAKKSYGHDATFAVGRDAKGKKYVVMVAAETVDQTPTRAQRKSTEQAIPWTPGPQTRWQRIKRDWVG